MSLYLEIIQSIGNFSIHIFWASSRSGHKLLLKTPPLASMKLIVLILFWLFWLCSPHPPAPYTHIAFSVSSSSLFTDSSQPLSPHNEVLALAHCSSLITHSTPLALHCSYKKSFFKIFSSSTYFAKVQSHIHNYLVDIFIWNFL